MRPTIRTPRGPLAILLALLAALLIAACGGSSKPSGASAKNAAATATTTTTTTTTGAGTARTALASCLKQHGVTIGTRGAAGFRRFRRGTSTNGNPPTGTPGGGPPAGGAPPSGAGGGFPAGGFAGGNSKFAKAFTACRKKLGLKGFTPGAGGRFGGGAGRGFTPRFSTATLKSYVSCIRTNGYPSMPEPKAASNGSFFPASVQKSAKFQAANRKCESILTKAFRSFRPPTGGAGATPTISGTSTLSST